MKEDSIIATVGDLVAHLEQPSITETYQPDQVSVVVQVEIEKNAATTQATTQENAVTHQEVAPKGADVTPKIAPKEAGVAPKIAPKETDVAPKDKVAEEDAVKNAVKNIVNDESVVEKCVVLWGFLKEDPQRTITNAVERLSCSRRSILSYIGILKQAKVLEHIGPYRGGEWKFLI